MVAIGISEFTFGYAFLHEQTVRNWEELKAAPILPSLHEESKLGWDARLPLRGDDYYFQFKLTDYLYRRNAKYIRTGIYSRPYCRIALNRRNANQQHRCLKALAERFPNTYYVAPEVCSKEEFDRLFLNRRITEGSRLIPVDQCKEIHDSDQHFITFQEGLERWIEHSEKEIHEHSILGSNIAELYNGSHLRTIDDEYIREVFVKIKNIAIETVDGDLMESPVRGRFHGRNSDAIDGLWNYDPSDRPRDEVLVRISHILSAHFGATMVIVGKDE